MAQPGRMPDVVVVGGGVTGAFVLYFLARLGVHATLVERGEVGGQASGNNAGNLAPLHGPGIPGPMQSFALASFELHREHADMIHELSGAAVRPRPLTRLQVAFDESELGDLERTKDVYDSTPGFAAAWLDRDAALAAEPRLSPNVAGALSLEGNARVEGGPYTRAVADAAVALGAAITRGEVTALRRRRGRVTAVDLGSRSLACGAVVLAPGAWCAGPARWLETPIPVEPVKGELLLVEPAGGGVGADVLGRRAAVYGTGGDTVWLGDTEDRVGFDCSPAPAARASILERTAALVPGLGGVRVLRHIAGLRPTTPDGFPILGAPAGWENAWLAAGAGRKGILLGAGMGLAVAELVTKGRTTMPIAACEPERWRGAPAGVNAA